MIPAPTAPPKSDPADTPFDREQPLQDHLSELRARLFWCVGAVVAGAVLGWRLTPTFLSRLADAVGPMVFLAPAEAFVTRIKIAFALGIFLSAPVLLYHAWRFLGVALTVSERRVALGALPFSYLLFAAGAMLGGLVIAPTGLKFLLAFGSAELHPSIAVANAARFVLWTAGGLGLLFQLPVVIAALASWGFVTSAALARHRRHAFILILILAAVLTPGPDILSQLALAAPTYILFEFSVYLAAWLEPKSPNEAVTFS